MSDIYILYLFCVEDILEHFITLAQRGGREAATHLV